MGQGNLERGATRPVGRVCDDRQAQSGMSSRSRGWLACVFVFVVVWAALSAPWLTGQVTIPYDAKAHFQAQIQFLADALATGQSPFWNPHVFGGSPQIADPQSMIFSPALLLAWTNPAPTFRAVDTLVLVMLGLGGIAIILLFREKRWSPYGALVGALASTFGASAAARVQHMGQIFSLVFFMIALWLLVRMVRKANFSSGILLGVAGGLMIVQPDQVALLGCYCLVLVMACEVLITHDPHLRLRALLAPAIAAVSVATAIASGPVLLALFFVEEFDAADDFVRLRRPVLPSSCFTSDSRYWRSLRRAERRGRLLGAVQLNLAEGSLDAHPKHGSAVHRVPSDSGNTLSWNCWSASACARNPPLRTSRSFCTIICFG